MDRRLGEAAYLAGDAYSIADMATYPWARYLRRHGMTAQEVPRLQAWMDAIAERPAVRRAAEVMTEAGLQDTADRQAATAEETDRFHWRHVPAPTAEAAATRLEAGVRRDPDIGGIDHVAVTVRDVEAMSRFYVELLGAKVARDHLRDGRPAIRKLVLGDAVLNLHQCDNDVDLIAGRPTPGAADVCLRWGGSPESAAARLTQAGVPIVAGPSPRTNSAGQPSQSVYFRDPDGNLIELMALDFGAGRG
jgi:catechol 2,3-dioxygenase-like lactoylglutathione lyase family enzyme